MYLDDGVLASAYTGEGDSLVVVLVNLSTDEKVCDLGRSQIVDVFTTSQTANLEKGQQNASSIEMPPRAVATVLIK